jgi:hypothetical protein
MERLKKAWKFTEKVLAFSGVAYITILIILVLLK